jgi:4-amino-4-deoxy-L-arabinose transferase-like glycosyltransferase
MITSSRLAVLLFVLVALGFAARLGWAVRQGLGSAPPPGTDESEYDLIAWNLAQGRGYRGVSPDVKDAQGLLLEHPTAYRPPGTSVVWAGLYWMVGHRHAVIRLLHILVGVASILLVFEIGRTCYGEAAGLVSATVYAVWPTAILYTTDLVSEPLGTFWLMCYVLASLRYAKTPTAGRAVLSGLLLGACLLTRPNTIFMLPLAVIWAVWEFRARRGAMWLAISIPVIATATLIPWTVRNYLVFRKFIPLSTMGGSVLLQGNNRIVAADPSLSGYNIWDTKIPEYRELLQKPNDELERDRVALQLATQWLRDNPDQWWHLVEARFRRSWTPFLQPHSPKLYRYGMLLSWGPVLVLFALAFFPTLWQSLREGQATWLLHLAIIHFVLTTIVFHGYSRYRFPIEGLCIVLASAAAIWLWRRFSTRGASVIT